MKERLLRLESWLTVPVFILSWLVCGIGFAAKAGYQMAKLEGAEKIALLDKILKP